MNNWIRKTIEKTSWGRFLIWIILYIGGSIWAFAMPGAWKTLGELTGTENGIPKIPSTTAGEIITVQQSVTTAKRTLNLASEVNVIVAALALAIGLLFKKRSPKQ